MVFSNRSISLIRAGKKTQTTRLGNPRIKIGQIYLIKKNYSKKGHYGKIKVVSKTRLTLAKFTGVDLKREGYNNMREFIEALERRNGIKIPTNKLVWRVVFKYLP